MSQKPIFQKPVFWVATVAVAIVGYTMTAPESGAAKKPTTKKSNKPVVAKKGTEIFTEEDKNASFPRIQVEFKNAFVPLVAKDGGIGGSDAAANKIPSSFSGGDANWVFTGTVEVDGVRQALLENRNSGDGVFLRSGQRWKNCVVKRVNQDSVVIEGPSGEMTFGLVTEESLGGRMASRNGANSFAPMAVENPPNFRGNIGGSGRGLPGVSNGGGFGGGGFTAVPSGNGGGPAIMNTDDGPIAIPFGGQ
jgi:hypothetical protein